MSIVVSGSGRKWKIAFFTLLAIFVLSTGFLGYGILDQGISITHMSDGYARTKQDLNVLAAAYPLDRYGKKDVVTILRQQNPEALIVETECSVQLNGIRFELDPSGKLIGINERAEYSLEDACGT